LQAECELAAVVYGAPFELVSDRQRLRVGKTFALQPGEVLHVRRTRERMRAYLCVRGGLQVKEVLGSRSGLEPVRAGEELPCPTGHIRPRFVYPEWTWDREPNTLRVLDGAQAGWFDAEPFYSQEFTATPASNRMGLRLHGEPLGLPGRELVSEPVCPGTVQVTRDGQCIVLGVDGQTIGGYPKIAQVIEADVDKLGQLRPGDRLRFRRVSLEDAERVYLQKQAEVREWLTRLRTTLDQLT
jgi:allophanate hydrolase subunit 2